MHYSLISTSALFICLSLSYLIIIYTDSSTHFSFFSPFIVLIIDGHLEESENASYDAKNEAFDVIEGSVALTSRQEVLEVNKNLRDKEKGRGGGWWRERGV